MTSLVTGATGFIGSHVVDALLADGADVRALVRRPNKAESLRQRGVTVVIGDLRDPDTLALACRGADTVYYCGAATRNYSSRRDLRDTNLHSVQTLLEAFRREGRGRIVLLTGLSVLGLRNLDPATEDLPVRPCLDPEVSIKIAVERLAQEYFDRHGVESVVLRAGFVYGARDRRNLPELVGAIRRGGLIYIGSRDNITPLVHVSDMVQAMLLAGRMAAAAGRVYHISDGARTSIGELITFLAHRVGAAPPRWTLPYFLPKLACVTFELLSRFSPWLLHGPVDRGSLLFLGTSRFVDISRAREELGYSPRVPYREGMADTLTWIREECHERPQPALSSS